MKALQGEIEGARPNRAFHLEFHGDAIEFVLKAATRWPAHTEISEIDASIPKGSASRRILRSTSSCGRNHSGDKQLLHPIQILGTCFDVFWCPH